MWKKEILLLFVILALGAFFRFYRVTTIPPGLYPDEAMNGNNGLEALHTGHFHVFYPENNGREGLFINIQAISVWLFGREPWALRLISALFGMLTILGIYLAARELFQDYKVAVLSAFFTATSYWHLNFSRIGFRAITTPFFLSFGLYFLLKGFRTNKIRDMVWAGIFTGLGFQGYIAFRFAPFVFAVPIVWQLVRWHRLRKINQIHSCAPCAVILFLFITFIAALPIGWHFLKHPGDFTGRTGQVAIFSAASPLYEFAKSNALTIGMFFVRGDCNDRHNYACRPELNPLVAIFFIIGIAMTLRMLLKRTQSSQARMTCTTIFGWLFFMSLPATLTREGVPHALRSIGMIPPIMILSGLGAYLTFKFISNRVSQKITFAIIILLCGYITIQTYHDYFIAWPGRAQTANAFGAELWHLGKYLDMAPTDIKKYVIVDLNGDPIRGIGAPAQTVMFATDTFRQEEQAQKNFTYIPSRNDLSKIEVTDNQPTIIAPLNKNDTDLISAIHDRFPQFHEIRYNDFLIFQNF